MDYQSNSQSNYVTAPSSNYETATPKQNSKSGRCNGTCKMGLGCSCRG